MKSAALLQTLTGAVTVTLTAAKPCHKLAPFPSEGFHTTSLEDALNSAASDPGFHEYIAKLTETSNVKPGGTYKLTPEGTLAETHNATQDGSSLIIINDGTAPTLVIGGHNGTAHNITLGLPYPGAQNGTYGGGSNYGTPGGSYPVNPLPSLPGSSTPSTASNIGSSPASSTSSIIPTFPGNATISSTSSSAASSTISDIVSSTASSTASAPVSSTVSSTAVTTTSSSIASDITSSTTSSAANTVASSTTSSTTSSSATAAPTSGCASVETYIEWRNMQAADKKSYVTAVRCLMDKPATGLSGGVAQNRYEELVWAHQTQASSIHMSGIFLPWHRYYTNVFHRLLREECGYAAPMPWWDETKDAGNFAGSGLFTKEYFGVMPQLTSQGLGSCITDGAFAGKRLHIGPGSSNTNHCLSRGEDKSATANVNKAYVNTCTSRTAYDDLRTCIEGGPHAYGHNGAGPVMADAIASPSDPLFFMHHSFIDWTWKTWQDKAAATRAASISGCADRAGRCTPLTVDTRLSTRGVQADVTVRDILDTEGGFLCYKYDY